MRYCYYGLLFKRNVLTPSSPRTILEHVNVFCVCPEQVVLPDGLVVMAGGKPLNVACSFDENGTHAFYIEL